MTLSPDGARAVMLSAMGLLGAPPRPATKADVLKTIRRMHVLQIDTIHVVARSPYFVLWSRLGDYNPDWLNQLLAAGRLFEYWAHEACFLPIEDFPLYRHRMLDAQKLGWRSRSEWAQKNLHHIQHVLDRVHSQGPVRSVDFVRRDGQAGTWWEWKAEKIALEHLFTAGELMIARRHNFQRVYDLRARILPDWDDSALPTTEHVRRQWVLNAVRALGITTEAWVHDYFRTKKADTIPVVRALAEAGALHTVYVDGWKDPFYVHPDNMPLVRKARAGKLQPQLTTLLSPFDPLVWDRNRARQLFNFDYTIECYTPAAKRRHGYFSLPVLRRGQLVARLDAKAHRKDGVFEVKSLHLEAGQKPDAEWYADVAGALRSCARWHGTPEVKIIAANPATAGKGLTRALKSRV